MATTTRGLVCMVWLAAAGCGPSATGSDGESETGESFEDGRTIVMSYVPHPRTRVDMIMVVDDSPSMRGHLPTMAANVGAFGELLSAHDVDADVRVAITTTSVPGATCTGARALGGAPIVESCRAHLEDFVGLDEHGEYGGMSADLADACSAACSLDSIERVPSPGADPDGELALRPWIEAPHNEYAGNLADGDSFSEALGCALLQGFAGCRFESPIEAAARMLERIYDPSDELYGFRRTDAALLVTVISDEDDCSHPNSAETMFDPNGARVFWPAGASEPLSAICVNAGLECDANGCELADHDASGAVTVDESAAVLTGAARVLDVLTEHGEFLGNDDRSPVMSVVGGYRTNGASVYEQPEPGSPDEPFAAAFGVGPGCSASDGQGGSRRAAPGGRLAALTDAITQDATYSICNDDWTEALTPIAETIKDQIQPACFVDVCFADLDPVTPLLEPDCVLELVESDGARTSFPSCERDEQGWVLEPNGYTLPADADTCWAWQTDMDGSSPDTADDVDAECVDAGLPGQWKIARRPGSAYIPYDAHYELRCRPCE